MKEDIELLCFKCANVPMGKNSYMSNLRLDNEEEICTKCKNIINGAFGYFLIQD